jgi:hypothetical protein
VTWRVACLALAAGLAAAGCGSPQSAQAQMRAWIDSTGYGSSTGSLIIDARNAERTLAAGGGVNAAHTICAVMLLDAETANGNLPSPDATVTSLLSKAYDSLGRAANDCYAAPQSAKALAAFDLARSNGLAYLSEGHARIEAVIGKTVSTTTTADNGSVAQ